MDINSILVLVGEIMGAFNVPTALGQNFLYFVEFSLTLLFLPITLIRNLFG